VNLVEIVGDPEAAKLMSDPMRRAILNLLRMRALTEANLADELGLTDPTVNYHLGLLRKARLLTVARREEEGHGIMQKFYAPTAYLFLPDVAELPKEVSRYYYPINIERARGVLSMAGKSGERLIHRRGVDDFGERLAESLVRVAKRYAGVQVKQGEGEALVVQMYKEALAGLGLHLQITSSTRPATKGQGARLGRQRNPAPPSYRRLSRGR
jgi:DNA-binding transcriptional ArsR family regulator